MGQKAIGWYLKSDSQKNIFCFSIPAYLCVHLLTSSSAGSVFG
jgi:hypothetical protein